MTVMAGLGMNAVRQLIAVNADLHATKAELAELAVASERERLARELHDRVIQRLFGLSLALSGVAFCRKSNTFPTSSRIISRPWYFPSPVTQSNPPSCIMPGAGSMSVAGIFSTSDASSTIMPASRPLCSTTRMRLRRCSDPALLPKRLRRSSTETILPRRLITPSM